MARALDDPDKGLWLYSFLASISLGVVVSAGLCIFVPGLPHITVVCQVLVLGIAAMAGAWYADETRRMADQTTRMADATIATVTEMRGERKVNWLPRVAPVPDDEQRASDLRMDSNGMLSVRLRNVSPASLHSLRVHAQICRGASGEPIHAGTLTPWNPVLHPGGEATFKLEKKISDLADGITGVGLRILVTYGDFLGRHLSAYAEYRVLLEHHFEPSCQWQLLWFHPRRGALGAENHRVWQTLADAYARPEQLRHVIPPLPDELPRVAPGDVVPRAFEDSWANGPNMAGY